MASVIKNGDTAIGHTDILGNPITGVVQCTGKLVNGSAIAKAGDTIQFSSHAHALDDDNPIEYSTHDIVITGSGKLIVNGNKVALHGETVLVADKAGPNATLVASVNNLKSI